MIIGGGGGQLFHLCLESQLLERTGTLRNIFFLGKAVSSKEANRKSQKLFLFVKMMKKHGSVLTLSFTCS